MTILFTKTIDPAIISKTLDKGFKTKFLELINFELKTKHHAEQSFKRGCS